MVAKPIRTATIVLALILFSAPSLVAHPSWGIVVSSTGIVYFSDLETVWKIDRDGNVSVFRAGVGGRHVHDLAIDENDNLYGPDYTYDPATNKFPLGIWEMTPEGTQTYLQQPIDSVMSGLSIWRDGAGNTYAFEQNNHTKVRTLLLRRTPAGVVSTVAGGAYGQVDGKGVSAKLGSVNAMMFAADGNIYITDTDSVRRVSLDGTVNTLARNLAARTAEDKPTLFGGTDAIINGMWVGAGGNIYVADAGNRRLLKVASDGKVSVVYRCDPPYFPNGVFATRGGDVYVLEFSFTPPGTTDQPRVRKISADGQNSIIGTTGRTARVIVVSQGSYLRYRLQPLLNIVNTRASYLVLLLGAGVIGVTLVLWRRSRK